METSAPLINAIVNCVPVQLTAIRCRLITPFTTCAFSSTPAAGDLVMKCIEIMAEGMARNLEAFTGLLHYCAFGL